MNLVSCLLLCTWPKRASYIANALLSYELQTYAARELVVVNDGAPLASARADVHVVNVPPQASIGAKRNIALRAATGPWVATWDDDDFSWPDRVGALVALADEVGASAARLKSMWITDEHMTIWGMVRGASYCYPTSVIWRADALAVRGYPEISYAEDVELSARMRLAGCREAYLDAPLYAHRRHEQNVTGNRGDLSVHLQRALPQALDRIPAAQNVLDSLRARPRSTLLVPA